MTLPGDARRGARARRRARRGAAGQLGPEPDPDVRAARPRRARHAAAAVPRPARHVAVDDDPRLAQRGRLRRVPRRRAAPLRAGRAELQRHKTDGHLDIDAVRAGAILDLPGEAARRRRLPRRHARAAGRRRDRRATRATSPGTVTLQVEVVKGLGIDGPVLFPVAEDLPFLARPLSAEERERALALGRRHGMDAIEESLPISVIGTGPDLNSATDNGLARAAELLGMTVPEVMNRATISGAIEIGRADRPRDRPVRRGHEAQTPPRSTPCARTAARPTARAGGSASCRTCIPRSTRGGRARAVRQAGPVHGAARARPPRGRHQRARRGHLPVRARRRAGAARGRRVARAHARARRARGVRARHRQRAPRGRRVAAAHARADLALDFVPAQVARERERFGAYAQHDGRQPAPGPRAGGGQARRPDRGDRQGGRADGAVRRALPVPAHARAASPAAALRG